MTLDSLLRVGIGLMFVAVHGFPKIAGGMEAWVGLGKTFNSIIRISFIPAFWGLMAAISELIGGMCLITEIVFFIVCKMKPPASVSGSRVVH